VNGDIVSAKDGGMGLLDQADDVKDAPQLDPNDRSRLFQTVSRESSSLRGYLKVFLPIAGLVVIAGLLFFYLTIPGVGDTIRAQPELDLAVRYHLLDVKGRVATDITFYKCDGFTWVRANVEKRPDIPDPLLQLGTYAVKAVPNGVNSWDFTSKPIQKDEKPTPCSAP